MSKLQCWIRNFMNSDSASYSWVFLKSRFSMIPKNWLLKSRFSIVFFCNFLLKSRFSIVILAKNVIFWFFQNLVSFDFLYFLIFSTHCPPGLIEEKIRNTSSLVFEKIETKDFTYWNPWFQWSAKSKIFNHWNYWSQWSNLPLKLLISIVPEQKTTLKDWKTASVFSLWFD